MNHHIAFQILMILLKRKKVTREYLAERFEVSIRTVSRYLTMLSDSGIPVRSLGGREGGVTIADDYKLTSGYLTRDELARTVQCLGALEPEFDDGLNRTLIERFTAMEKSDNNHYLVVAKSLVIDAGPWNNPDFYRGKIDALSQAIETGTAVSIVYVDGHEQATERIFEPYSLALKQGIWYVYGWCRLRGDFRIFKLSRIASMQLTEIKFERRESDIYAKLRLDPAESETVELEFEFERSALSDVEEWLGLDAVTERNGTLTARAVLYGGSELMKKLLSFGSDIRVLSPRAVAEELCVECRRAMNRYV